MARRKRYIKGKVYITNDYVLVSGSKKKRRIVVLNNDKNNMAVRRISSLYDKNGKRKTNLIPIENIRISQNQAVLKKRHFVKR